MVRGAVRDERRVTAPDRTKYRRTTKTISSHLPFPFHKEYGLKKKFHPFIFFLVFRPASDRTPFPTLTKSCFNFSYRFCESVVPFVRKLRYKTFSSPPVVQSFDAGRPTDG